MIHLPFDLHLALYPKDLVIAKWWTICNVVLHMIDPSFDACFPPRFCAL
jgi:hypothetical protein